MTDKTTHGLFRLGLALIAAGLCACSSQVEPPSVDATAHAPTAPPLAKHADPVDAMKLATPMSKIGVAVDLRYAWDDAPEANQPATLRLAAIPRVPGAKLQVAIHPEADLRVDATPLVVPTAKAASVYRHQASITVQGAAPRRIRVVVTMESAAGQAFGIYSVPLHPGKQR